MVAAPAVELPENRPEPRLPVSDTPDVERRLAVSNRDFGIRDGMRQDLEAIEIVDVKEEKRQDVPPARGFTPAQSFAAVSRDVSRAALRASNIRRPALALERSIERVLGDVPTRRQQEVRQSLDTLESVIAANTDNADDAKAMEELANNLIMTTADNRDFVSLLAIPVFLATLATAARTGKPPELQGNAAMSALMGIMHVGAAWYGNWLNDTSQAPGPDAGPRPAGDDPRAANYDFDDITDQIKSGRDIEKLADDIAREFKLDIDEKSELLDEIKQAAHGEIEARQAAAAIRAITEPQARAAWGNIGFGRFIREAASAGAGTLGALSVDRFLQRINWAEFVEQRVSSAVKSAMDAAGITTAPTTFEPTTYKPSEEDEEELRREVNRPNTLTSGGGEQGVGVSQLRPEFVMLGTMWDRETPEEAAAERRQFAMYSHVREGDSGDPNSVVWQQNKQWNKNIRYNDNFSLQMQPLEYIQPYVYEYTTLHIPPMRQYIGPVNLISQLNNSVNGDNILEISNSRQLGGTGRMHDPLHVPLQNIRQVYAKLHPAPIYAPTAPSLVPVDLQYPTNTDANRFSQRDYIRYPVEGTEERMLRQPPVYRGAGIYPPHMASRSGFTDKRRFITGMGQYSDMAAMGLV